MKLDIVKFKAKIAFKTNRGYQSSADCVTPIGAIQEIVYVMSIEEMKEAINVLLSAIAEREPK